VDDFVPSAVTAHMQRWAPGPGEVLVTNRLGRQVQRNSFGHCWREAVKAAGLAEGTRFHDLRHFYASTLIATGLHPKVIQERLGHATIAETMDTYGHRFPDASEQGRGALDAMFAPPDVRPMCNQGAIMNARAQARARAAGESACRPGSVTRAFTACSDTRKRPLACYFVFRRLLSFAMSGQRQAEQKRNRTQRSATNVPMGEVTTKPSAFSATITFWAVVPAMPNSWDMPRIEGSREPGGRSPDSMRRRYRSKTCRHGATGPSRMITRAG
jgi:hypothetical protein